MTRTTIKTILSLASMILTAVTSACSVFSNTPGIVSTQPMVTTETLATQRVPEPTATPTPEPPKRVLTVCTGKEPASLFLYGDRSSSTQTIWQAIYGGMTNLESQTDLAGILMEAPSQAGGTVKLVPVEVKPGDLIVAANGDWATLKEGVTYRPSGCTDASCTLAFTGNEPVQVDQLVIDFHLQPGLKWSDGSALTADDSVYSYEIAKSLYPAARPEIISKTQSYRSVDETSVEWIGVPGFLGSTYEDFFFKPLPRHAWSLIAPQDLAQSPLASQSPLGWGPYAIDEWSAGDHISLHKNPNYSGAAQGLPHFDTLVFRFTSSGKDALDALAAGECDLADESTGLETQAARLQEMEEAGEIKVYQGGFNAWEQLLFNTSPADPKQPNFFGKKEVRQAVAYCADREKLIAGLQAEGVQLAQSYLPPESPYYQSSNELYAFDPEKGNQLLSAAGWIDADDDSATPRTAQGISGVQEGTAFSIAYLVANDEQSLAIAGVFKDSLAQCGIQVNIQPVSWEEMLAAGPEGPVFGRRFDLAQFAWTLPAQPVACQLFQSSEIPGEYPEAPKGWGGANAGGYQNQSFDQACQEAQISLPDTPAYADAQKQVQAIFDQDLPALPLFFHAKLLASRPDFCGINLTNSTKVRVLNFETLDYAEGCQ